jgi:tetratricopeptide (TPR) repeat protein
MTNPKAPTLGSDLWLKGPALNADEHESALLQELRESKGTSKSALWKLASLYSRTRRRPKAFACIDALAVLSTSLEEAALCLVARGQLSEQQDDYESAVRYYTEALALDRRDAPTWYWIHNKPGLLADPTRPLARPLRQLARRVHSARARRKVAVVAAARFILRTAFYILRDGTDYDPPRLRHREEDAALVA